jgi:3-oxoadipate enol-lactonase
MPRVQAGSIAMHYERRGSGDPLVLIMGFGGSGAMWDHTFVDLLAAQFDVIVPDNRGTGQSEKTDEPIELRTLADDTAHLLDALGIARAHVFGVSMGGMVAQEFALAHPQRLRGLVLGCTNCGGPSAVQAEPEIVQLLLPQKGMAPRAVIQRTYQAMLTPETIARDGLSGRDGRADADARHACLRLPPPDGGDPALQRLRPPARGRGADAGDHRRP